MLGLTDELVAVAALYIMSLQSISELEFCDILLADVASEKDSEQVLLVSVVAQKAFAMLRECIEFLNVDVTT